MEYTTLPNTDLKVSTLCLGTGGVGVKNTEPEAMALLDAFVEQGGNFLDTARVYSNWVPGELNRSERIIGDWLTDRGNRSQLIVATKGGHPDLEDKVPRLTREQLEIDVNGSLKKLQIDTIDLYYFHRDNTDLPVSELLDILNEFQQAGKIRHYACSNWSVQRMREAHTYAQEKGYTGFVGNQMRWSIGTTHMRQPGDATMYAMDQETSDFHTEMNFAAIPYSSQAGGFFSKLSAAPESVAKNNYNTEGNQILHNYLEAISKDHNLSMSQIVLTYLWSFKFTTIPIIGCRTIEQVNDSITAIGNQLPDEIMNTLADTHNLPRP
jgi:aryl-alcohol dehydrogenase-like predicted oxidoreductase